MSNKPTLVFISTYPPRECGIATFAQDLLTASQKLLGPNLTCKVVAMNLSASEAHEYPPEVEWQLDQNNIESHHELADEINNNPLITGVILQHEYGIFGGEDGKNILEFVNRCTKPLLVTMHTIVPDPSPTMDLITKTLVEKANILVVLTEKSRELLQNKYTQAQGKTFVINHGIHHTVFSLPNRHKKMLKLHKQTILSTFGLLSRGKGIEYVIKAMPQLIKKHPDIQYLVLGQTHPVVRRKEGESYRLELIDLVKKLNLGNHVKFYDKYLTIHDLLNYLQATDIYICTTLNPNQAVSGTLSYAVGAGRAVVSTKFTQATELLSRGVGIVVPIADSEAYADAVHKLLRSPKKLKTIYKTAYRKTRSMLWSNIAYDYMRIISKISPVMMTVDPLLPPLNLKHFRALSNKFAMLQFSKLGKPADEFGYTLDDNARALMICSWLVYQGHTKVVSPLLLKYLNFIVYCQKPDGTFHNYIDTHTKKPTPQNRAEVLEDAHARAALALSEVMKNTNLSAKTRSKARKAWDKLLPHIGNFHHKRSKATIIKAIQNALEVSKKRQRTKLIEIVNNYADYLVDEYEKHSTKTWNWFENGLTYNNGVLPESLFKAWQITLNPSYLNVAKQSINFLIKRSFMGDICVPVGNDGWYYKGKRKAIFDQQPEEPSALVLALLTAYEVTQNSGFIHLAQKCFTWFLGNNILGVQLYNHKNGGCYDALTKHGVNLNQGAESLVCYLLARIALEQGIMEKWI